jgi:hypothetical protein
LAWQVGQDDQDVEIALMIGHEYLRPVRGDMFRAMDPDLDVGYL